LLGNDGIIPPAETPRYIGVSLPGFLTNVILIVKILCSHLTFVFLQFMNIRSRHFLVLLFIFPLFSGFGMPVQQKASILLHDEQIPITPKEFYIASVIDEREDRSAVALAVSPAKAANQPEKYAVDLQGGSLPAIKGFIAHNLPKSRTLRPVIITLKKIMVIETALPNGLVEGHAVTIMEFYLQHDEDKMQHLVDYNGDITYNRSPGPPQDIEPTLRHMLENGLVYLNTWMNRQAGTNILLAKSVKLSFTDYTDAPEGDSIYYAVTRPLTWDDFKSKTPNSHYDAQVFPTIGYDEHTGVTDGTINVAIALKATLPKSAAWVRAGSKTDYTLNHEQRHFDIVKIVTEHFKQKLKTENLTPANYEGIINVDYLDAYREMDAIQKQYDDETRHGADQAEQGRWNEKIDKELREYGVKK
jgi:hypothetical protein